ncbi:molybdenum cofactor guanylyltransferase [Sporosarcina sp. PTS2304]|uniref:molybdenum cofactor guanylyltransferase n=1 Tax=Sporosarcina sp. PTS2304 TaxID=2283194 RepID=UPI000E0DAED7|nr:molybdenum cofactor guanylyltransferase [Sporosarcina sp. PTS2304]AXI01012.1 molybdenum cofactor guanylyltransferase [Sporosarcina sp. PTS2304]
MKTVGIVLAGGQSRRFGEPKAFAEFEGKPFYEYSVESLRPFCEEIVVVTRPEFVDRFPIDVHVTTDIENFAGMGPLAGILTAMEQLDAERYIVLPCDMPFMDRHVMDRLLQRHSTDVTGVVVEGKLHPLVSVWNRRVKPTIRQALLENNRRVMYVQALHHIEWIEGILLTDQPELAFKNVNTPCELERG